MENDPGYIKTLENLPEQRKKAMLYGDWDSFEGQYFEEFNRDIHIIEPFIIPKGWNRYISLDYGLDKLAVLWFAIDTKNTIYVYKELYESDLIISEAAKRILEINNNDNIILRYAPPDLWNRRQDTGKSAEQVFRENGVSLVKSNNNRIQGWYAVKECLKIYETKDEQTGEVYRTSRLKIFKNCVNLIRTLPQLQHDSKDPNDVSNEPHELTHINDALRGFCIERTRKTDEQVIKRDDFKINKDELKWYDAEVSQSFIEY